MIGGDRRELDLSERLALSAIAIRRRLHGSKMKRRVGCLEMSWLLSNGRCVTIGHKVQLSKIIVKSNRVNALLPCYRLLISNFPLRILSHHSRGIPPRFPC